MCCSKRSSQCGYRTERRSALRQTYDAYIAHLAGKNQTQNEIGRPAMQQRDSAAPPAYEDSVSSTSRPASRSSWFWKREKADSKDSFEVFEQKVMKDARDYVESQRGLRQ